MEGNNERERGRDPKKWGVLKGGMEGTNGSEVALNNLATRHHAHPLICCLRQMTQLLLIQALRKIDDLRNNKEKSWETYMEFKVFKYSAVLGSNILFKQLLQKGVNFNIL